MKKQTEKSGKISELMHLVFLKVSQKPSGELLMR